MRSFLVSLTLLALPLAASAQVGVPRLDPRDRVGTEDTLPPAMNAQDSAIFAARTTASRKPYYECSGTAFLTCASGQTSARLSVDGTAYGVLLSIFDERHGLARTAFLWRITGRVGIGGTDDGSGGRGGRRGGGGGGGGGRSRRGG